MRLYIVVVSLLAVEGWVVVEDDAVALRCQRVVVIAAYHLPFSLIARASVCHMVFHVGVCSHYPFHVHAVLVVVRRGVEVWHSRR